MSQTVQSKTSQELYQDIDRIIKCMAYERKIFIKYDVGQGYDRNEAFELIRLQEMLCSPYCEIAENTKKIKNLIKQKIAKYGL